MYHVLSFASVKTALYSLQTELFLQPQLLRKREHNPVAALYVRC